jgi:hypothetical protein
MKYRCMCCNNEYGLKMEALNCCNEAETVFTFKCAECGDVYSSESDATFCCEQDKIEEIEE